MKSNWFGFITKLVLIKLNINLGRGLKKSIVLEKACEYVDKIHDYVATLYNANQVRLLLFNSFLRPNDRY